MVRSIGGRERLARGSAVLEEEIFGPLLVVEEVHEHRGCLRHRRRPGLCADGWPFLTKSTNGRLRRLPVARREPIHQPTDHRCDGRPPAIRRATGSRDGVQSRRAGLSSSIRRSSGGQRRHPEAWIGGVGETCWDAAGKATGTSCAPSGAATSRLSCPWSSGITPHFCARSDVRSEQRSRGGGRPGNMDRGPQRDREFRAAVVAQDLDLQHPHEHREDPRPARTPEHAVL